MPEEFETALNKPISVFFSYSHKDESLMKELDNHLSVLKRNSLIIEWHDRKITPGEKWEQQIADRLNEAQIILLLISSDFLASDYCYEKEMKRALEREERGEAVVIPIILRPCSWEDGPFKKLQALPKDAKAVTEWPNQDAAFTNIEAGIRATVNRLRQKPATPALAPKPLLSSLQEFAAERRRQDVAEIKVANPYLLGDQFVGRKKELDDLTDWLVNGEDSVFCICDLGGTGKSALVWHWLNQETTRTALAERDIEQFWCSFYARDYDAKQFLSKLAEKLGGAMIGQSRTETAQRELQQFILQRLMNQKWLLVLDGLEREMGAFANPENLQKDSEEQDCRNENGEVWPQEKDIRDNIFADFLRQLPTTQAKVLLTSRLFPENLNELPGVRCYPFEPMSPEDAEAVWNRFCTPDGSARQREFFESVGFHPQVISVVAAAVNEPSLRLSDWFNSDDFSETERQMCLNATPTTARRHRWLDLATRDVMRNRRDAWMTLCYIVRHSTASSVDALMDSLVDRDGTGESLPGRFQSEMKLRDELNYLVKRRLIGVGESNGEEMVDVHPVIRGQVWDYIQTQYARGGEAGQELMRHLELKDSREFRLRLLDLSDLNEGIPLLKEFAESDEPSDLLGVLGSFYPSPQPGKRPWLAGLPALRLRKDQAWLLYRTGHELMTQGVWKESTAVFNRAVIAYELCGDWRSIEECRRSHNWQSLYGGELWDAERELLEKGEGKHTPYWLALLMSIRQHDRAAELLQSLPAETSRWTLQTTAEAWFYLDDYNRAAELARQAWDRQEKEKDSIGQTLWEAVTMGLALVRLDRFDEAEVHLNFAKARGTGWAYNLVPMFALAGFIELEYRRAMQIKPARERLAALAKADQVYKQYGKFDQHDSFQIPAAEAHLAMAQIHLARNERDKSLELAQRALQVASGSHPPFQYRSVVKRATEFLTAKLQQPAPPVASPNREAINHDKRLRDWIETRPKNEAVKEFDDGEEFDEGVDVFE